MVLPSVIPMQISASLALVCHHWDIADGLLDQQGQLLWIPGRFGDEIAGALYAQGKKSDGMEDISERKDSNSWRGMVDCSTSSPITNCADRSCQV